MEKSKELSKEMVEFEAALSALNDESDTAKAGLASMITKDDEAQVYAFGDADKLEVLSMILIKYLADKEEINIFEKLLSMQTRLVQVHPDKYKEYVDKLKELGMK